MREYVEKIGGDRYNTYGKMGDNGANSKSTVASKMIWVVRLRTFLVEAQKHQLKQKRTAKG
jgi:hypothetical protein